MTDKDEILAGAKEAFFAAHLDGYVGNGERSIITKTPDGYTTIEFEEGDYRVVDRYCTTPHSDLSAGTTTIFYNGTPVWWMSYAGSYPKEVIPFLKEALAQAYKEKIFFGGRGLKTHKNDLFFYSNWPRRNDFYNFDGTETIHHRGRGDEEPIGRHDYWGMSLI